MPLPLPVVHSSPPRAADHELPTWVPHGTGLRLEDVVVSEDGIAVRVTTVQASASCPRCGQSSTCVHSRYARTIADLSWGTAPVVMQVSSRRFRCQQGTCARRIFCERLPLLVPVYGRHTHCVREFHECLGFALGGRPGARLATRLRARTSRMTLLRRVRAAGDPPTGTAKTGSAPRVLGVDDWAKRKGHTYGTILVDLERRCPVDLLPDRTAETLAAWLQAHPGTEVLSRDRAGAYAEGARRGAPAAQQVADRWHLLANVRTAVERLVTRHAAVLTVAAGTVSAASTVSSMTANHSAVPTGVAAADGDVPDALLLHAEEGRSLSPSVPPAPTPPLSGVPASLATHAGQGRRQRDVALHTARRAQRLARYESVVALHTQGLSLRRIASELQLNRTTVLHFVTAAQGGGFPERQPRPPRRSPLTRFDAVLRDRWAAGCHNALVLWRELRGQGYTGGKTSVRDYVQEWRSAPASMTNGRGNDEAQGTDATAAVPTGNGSARRGAPAESAKSATVPRSVRDVTWLLLRRPEELTADEHTYVSTLTRRCTELGVGYGLVQDFASLVRERERWAQDTTALTSWVRVATDAGIPELRSFAAGLLRDWAAVQAALSSPWSNGQTEGQVNRLKMLKRQMFGRASFDLLRKRVLARP